MSLLPPKPPMRSMMRAYWPKICVFASCKFRFGGAVFQEFLKLFIGFFFNGAEIDAGLGGQRHIELAGDFVVGIGGGGAGGDLIFVDEALVEARSFSLTENARGEIEQRFIGRAGARDVPDAIETSLRDAILDRTAMRAGTLGGPFFLLGDGRTGGNRAVIFFDFLASDFGADVTGDDQGNVVGAVVGLEPFLNVGERGSVEIVHGADDRPGVGMAGGVSVFGDELLGDAVGLIFALALFVLDDAALQIEFFLIEDRQKMTHAIAFGEQDVVEHGGRNVFKEIGAVVVGGAVEVGGADAFHGVDVSEIEIFAAGEHEMLEEVCESRPAGLFVFGADVIPGVDGDDGGFVVFMDENGESVGKNEFGVGDVGDRDGVFGGGGDGGLGLGSFGLGWRGNDLEEDGEEREQNGADGPRRVIHDELPVRDRFEAQVFVFDRRIGERFRVCP